MLWHPKTLQNLAMYNVFFHFWPFFHCRKATKMTQNSISIPSCAQTPKKPRKMSKTPPDSGLGAKPFLGPPAKADIATAILTNVIEHLVLLLPPNKHAFTAKAVWADFKPPSSGSTYCSSSSNLLARKKTTLQRHLQTCCFGYQKKCQIFWVGTQQATHPSCQGTKSSPFLGRWRTRASLGGC